MKEMTIEQKAKAYDKAIEHARSLLKTIGNATLGNLVLKNEFKNMFPVLEESEDEMIRKALITYHSSTGSIHALDKFTSKQICAWLEKQGEHANFRNKIQIGDKVTRNEDGVLVNLSQLNRVAKKQGEKKPDDKVEPKIKAGDWVVCNNGPHHIFQVIERSWPNAKYRNIDGAEIFLNVNTLDKQYHLWTIQDAKDGDVLASSSGKPFIFKGFFDNDPMAYGGLVADDSFWPASNSNWTTVYCKPATKEQRELLFQKMKEAGYVWDSERKELKKVEKLVWSEEDELSIKELLYLVKTNYLSSVKPHDRLISFLESIKYRVQLQDRINIEVWVTKNKQWILKLNGKVVRGQWGDEPQCIYKQFFYLSEIGSLKE